MPSNEILLHVGVEIGRLQAKQDQTHTLLDSRTAAMQRALDTLIVALKTSTRSPAPPLPPTRTDTPTATDTPMGSSTTSKADMLLRRFGPKVLMWVAEKVLVWAAFYLAPLGLIIWSMFGKHVALLWKLLVG